ncbi:MAG TPA: YbaY family lipoprotein [Dyella sp.]|uniref:YbaY family lipoprotein n=1 Tax=Dyella sp. TaxID=1869338 RepID=UPI002D08B48C|nr:YbaY family lipoprotein [Dyella sp.]HTV83759.1 YbaY family lipoprotein [Dyella sp.]
MKIRRGLGLVAVLALAACGWIPHFGKNKAPPQQEVPQQQVLMKSLSGEVEYSLAQPLPPNAYLEVVLSDVSRQDAPARVIAKERISPVGASPVTFVLSYEPKDLGDGVDFAVSAHIEQDGQLLAFNDTRISVLGRSGNNGPVRIALAAAH